MDELLEQIRRAPDDDRLREVYADLLLERGDPRGEFIALQFKDARGTLTRAERARLKQLLAEHWGQWAGPLAGAIQREPRTFEKGFLANVVFPLVSTPLRTLEGLVGAPHWATVHSVASVHHNPSYVNTLRHPVMRALRHLWLEGDQLLELRGGSVPWRLASLHLRSWECSAAVSEALAAFDALEHLAVMHLETQRLTPEVDLATRALEDRLEHLRVWLRGEVEPAQLLNWLRAARGAARSTIGTAVVTASVVGTERALELTQLHDSAFALGLLEGLLRSARKAGFTSAALTYQPDRWATRLGAAPANRPSAATRRLHARASQLAGFEVQHEDAAKQQGARKKSSRSR